jgi:hypothetical protein
VGIFIFIFSLKFLISSENASENERHDGERCLEIFHFLFGCHVIALFLTGSFIVAML